MSKFKVRHQYIDDDGRKLDSWQAVVVLKAEGDDIDAQLGNIWFKTNTIETQWSLADKTTLASCQKWAGTYKLRSSMVGDIFQDLKTGKLWQVAMLGFNEFKHTLQVGEKLLLLDERSARISESKRFRKSQFNWNRSTLN